MYWRVRCLSMKINSIYDNIFMKLKIYNLGTRGGPAF